MVNNSQNNNSILNKTLYTTNSGKSVTVKHIIAIIAIIVGLYLLYDAWKGATDTADYNAGYKAGYNSTYKK